MAFPRSALSNFLQSSSRALRYSTIPLITNSSSLIHGIHVFHCPDEVGIVAKLSECIALHGANIHFVDVFVPENKQLFYSRSEFVFDPARWPHDVMLNDFTNIGKLFNAKRSVVRVPDLDPKYKIALLASNQDHCLVDVLHDWLDGRLPVDISCVISNHDRALNTHVIHFLERHGIPYYYLPTNDGNKREGEILDLVKGTDFLVLARYMQILSAGFLESYGKDIINIHHGLLPSFKGSNPARQAYNSGVKLIGATTHFVTPELDEGPIIEQMIDVFFEAFLYCGELINPSRLQFLGHLHQLADIFLYLGLDCNRLREFLTKIPYRALYRNPKTSRSNAFARQFNPIVSSVCCPTKGKRLLCSKRALLLFICSSASIPLY